MTDSIDLDDIDASTDEGEEREDDWFWRGDEDPAEDRPGGGWTTDRAPDRTTEADSGPDAPAPHAPNESLDGPAGIPISGGGGGAGAGGSTETGDPDDAPAADTPADPGGRGSGADPGTPGDATGGEAAAGANAGAGSPGVPDGEVRTGGGTAEAHGSSDPSDMTMAFTYRAMKRLADPRVALGDAEGWTDWLGLVGDVDVHVLNKFQRERALDLDFFNGSGTGPAERLAEVDERSMFFADRMVVVGRPDEEWIADRAGWEFVPLDHAAGEAGWETVDSDSAA
jgi:hypothetical protein